MGHYIRSLNCMIDQIMNRELNELELTSSQGAIMGYLAHHEGPPCARDLEQFFHLSHPTVSGLLSRMEAKGFIEIRPDPEDRRMKRIYPLEKGLSCSKRIEACILDNEHMMVQNFTPEEEELFLALLRRAAENLSVKASSHSQREE